MQETAHLGLMLNTIKTKIAGYIPGFLEIEASTDPEPGTLPGQLPLAWVMETAPHKLSTAGKASYNRKEPNLSPLAYSPGLPCP